MHRTRRRLARLAERLAARRDDPFTRRREAEERRWLEERAAFLGHIPADLRAEVAAALSDPDRAEDLDDWVLHPVATVAPVPELFPAALVRVMLDDQEASLLHECERCGLNVPIRPGCAQPFKLAVRLFPECPACGGRTGWYAYRSAHGGVT